jgi:hypothetical protein
MTGAEIRELFLRQAEEGYRGFEKELDAFERKVQSARKGAQSDESGRLAGQAGKLARELDELRKRDFFSSPAGLAMQKRREALEAGLRGIGRAAAETPAAIKPKGVEDYQGRVWATRKKPFIDRMASAWLIRRFIDPKATFRFANERELAGPGDKTVAFDVRGGEFTHVGDLCTFEVLVKSFGIKDKAVKKIAEIVHDLDVKDEKYGKPEAAGVEEILIGIRKTAKNDTDALERGMAVFEMLYQSKS